jgi:hypothetical protein
VADSNSWREIRSKLSLNETRVETYRRLMDTQLQIAELLLRRGLVSEAQVDEALSASQAGDSASDGEDGIYLSSLARYVSALGGHLELQAVFPGETVTVMRTDTSARARDPSSGDQSSGSEAS